MSEDEVVAADPPPASQPLWEITHVSSAQEVRETEVESKKFELHREREEIGLSLVITDVQFQKQVRAVTKECGKLHLEVGWLECDLSGIQAAARRHLLEIQTVLAAKKLKLKDVLHENVSKIASLERQISEQRDRISQAIAAARTQISSENMNLASEIDDLIAEIEDVRSEMYRMDLKYEQATIEAKQTIEMLASEIRDIESRGPTLDSSMGRQQTEMRNLQTRLDKANQLSDTFRHRVRGLTEARLARRAKLQNRDRENWAARVQSFLGLD
jgi:methyl-accepting chemotaxis protein